MKARKRLCGGCGLGFFRIPPGRNTLLDSDPLCSPPETFIRNNVRRNLVEVKESRSERYEKLGVPIGGDLETREKTP